MSLCEEMALKRRHVNIHETNLFFHPCAKEGKVYLISNDCIHCGVCLSSGSSVMLPRVCKAMATEKENVWAATELV